jgi:hypothetical protein
MDIKLMLFILFGMVMAGIPVIALVVLAFLFT